MYGPHDSNNNNNNNDNNNNLFSVVMLKWFCDVSIKSLVVSSTTSL